MTSLVVLLVLGQFAVPATGSGSGIASVTLTSTQVAYGDGSNAVTSEAAFAYDAANDRLTVGNIYHGNGSAAAPSLVFTNSTTTGFFRAGAGEIGVSISGIARWYWTSANFYPWTDDASDIGAAIGARVRIVYVSQGLQLATTGARPACNSTNRGRLYITQGGAGVADVKEVCMKDAADAYGWVAM